MRAFMLVLVAMGGCGGPKAAQAPPTATPIGTATATATATPTPTPTPSTAPTGGSVLIGDIAAPPHFDPKPTIEALRPDLLACFNRVRASNPPLHGKLTLRIQVNETGATLTVDAEPGGSANDPALVSCLGDAIKQARFPKPGGSAIVSAPLVFRQ
jgi:hypothetical protein